MNGNQELTLESLDARLRVVERVLGLDNLNMQEAEAPGVLPVAPPAAPGNLAQGMLPGGAVPQGPLRARRSPQQPSFGVMAPPRPLVR